MTEKDIVFESGQYWVAKSLGCWAAFKNGATHAKSVGMWSQDQDGLGIAIAYASFMGGCKLTAQQANALAQEHYQGVNGVQSRNRKHGRSGVPHGERPETGAVPVR